jgi:TRAP-type C4-dicarboxylate transport system permease small subunit
VDLLEKISKELARILYWIAGISIVSMMLLTCVDVALRFCVTVYHETHWEFLVPLRPIPGTYELVCYMATVAVAFAMAHTTVEKGHVAVSFVVELLPKRAQNIIATITNSCGLLFFILLTWRSFLYAGHLKSSGEVSLTLQLPFYPFVYGIAFSALAVCPVILSDLLKSSTRVFSK